MRAEGDRLLRGGGVGGGSGGQGSGLRGGDPQGLVLLLLDRLLGLRAHVSDVDARGYFS